MWEVIQATNHFQHFLHNLREPSYRTSSFCYYTIKQLEINLETLMCNNTQFLEESVRAWGPLKNLGGPAITRASKKVHVRDGETFLVLY